MTDKPTPAPAFDPRASQIVLPNRMARRATFDRQTANDETRTVELAFSSEEPYLRWFGNEILGHDPGEIDLGWLASGTGALLVDHDPTDQVGVVEKATLGTDRKARAVVRFGKSDRAEEIFRDVKDGIRRNISVGYEIDRMVLVEETDDQPPVYRATRWRPLEVSIVAIPADMTVGIGRDSGEIQTRAVPIDNVKPNPEPASQPNPQQEKSAMTATPEVKPAAGDVDVAVIRENEIKRINEIAAVGQQFNCSDQAQKAIRDGLAVDAFKGLVLTQMGDKATKIAEDASKVGLTDKEVRDFSVVRALRAMLPNADRKDIDAAAFEREVSAAMAQKRGIAPKGILIPTDLLFSREFMTRDQTVGTATAGGNLVGTNLMGGSFIDLLRNRMMVRQMGATMLSGLVGNVAIPRQSAAATAYWVAEAGATTEGAMTFNQVTLSPKNIAANVDVTRNLLLQSTPSIEALVRKDLVEDLALGIDLASLHGSGASNQPTGIASTSGINTVAIGTNGGAPTYAHVVNMETEVAVDNADLGAIGYLTNSKVRGKLKQTEKASSTGQFVWEKGEGNGFGELNGYRAGVSNQVKSDLDKGTSTGVCSAIFFGNWADLLIGEWGVLDLMIDPYTQSKNGIIQVTAFQSVDIGVRNPVSFCYLADATTT